MTELFRDQEVHLRDYLYVLRKRRRLIVLFCLAALAFGIIFTCFEKVLYRATSTILIEPENPNVMDFKEVLAQDASSSDYYQTQYQIFESRSLIEKLIERENLQDDPYLRKLQKGGWRRFVGNPDYWPPFLQSFVARPLFPDLFVKKMLRVKPVRNSRLVKIGVLYPDPKRSAEMTNSLVDLFIERNLHDRFLVSKQATDLIAKQIVEVKESVGAAERKAQNYKEEHGLVNIPSIREKDKFIQDTKLELVKIQSEEAKLAKRYLPAHPKMIHIQSQIQGLQQQIDEEEKKSLQLSRVAIEYSELERETESAQQIYKALLERLQETQSQAKTQASNILVVDRAEIPSNPFTPRPLLNLLIALFIGIVGGGGLAFFIEYLDSTVKIPEDIEKGLGLDLFGIIPQAENVRSGSLQGELLFNPGLHSPAAESFRALRTSLLFRLRQVPGCRNILITSPNPGEGKSIVAFNLTQAFQQNHLKVILLDADLRKPRLHKIFDVPQEKGMTEILEGEVSLDSVIHRNVGGLGFDFLSSGVHSHHPTEILGSDSMKRLMENLRAQYDIVLLDSPPYLPVADVAVLGEYVDGIMVIARYQKTDRRHLKNLKRHFNEAHARVLGIVINQVSVREKDYYYHQYYYYGYGEDVARPK